VTLDSEIAVDYGDPGIWGDLASRLFATCQPRATGLSGYYECPPEWRWSLTLRDYDIWLVIKGAGTVSIANSNAVHRLSAGTLLFYRPGDIVVAEQDPEHRLTVVASHMDFFDPVSGTTVLAPGHLLPHRHIQFTDFAKIERILMRLFRLQDSSRHLAAVEATMLLGQALVEMYRQDARNHGAGDTVRDARLERVITRLRQAPHERVSLDRAAAIAGLSPDYFSRLFAQELQMPFREYAIRLRLERSRSLLEETDLRIGEIARQLGYADVYLFSRQFKDYFGCSPSQARQQNH
jgi:AraC-like DNA-binding protein